MNIVWLCVGMFFLGLSCGLWIERRRWLKNEREGVYSEPEGGEPCAGKGEHVMDAYGLSMTWRDQINKAVDDTYNGWTTKHKPIKWGENLPDITSEQLKAMRLSVKKEEANPSECDVKKWADSLVDRGKLTYLADGRYMDKTGFTFRVEEK